MRDLFVLAVSVLLVTTCTGETCLKYLLSDGDFVEFVDCVIDDVADAVSKTETEIPEGHVRDPFAPDGMTVPKLIKKEGLEVEEHTVTTEDGYNLTMHRIPNVWSRPVFLQHGLTASSLDWVLGGKEQGALAYLLHEKGYDVWMGNARGNLYSKGHKFMTSDDPAYWDYSWQEMGLFDLPAELAYITRVTLLKVIYVGYSMGTTMSYVMASERPDITRNLKAMYSISPVVYMGNVRTFTAVLAPSHKGIMEILKYFGLVGFHSASLTARSLFHFACNFFGLGYRGCVRMLDGIIGVSAHQLKWEHLWDIETHVPTGLSAKILAHYAQNMNWGKFAKYDYGSEMNKKKYGSDSPPVFDLANITIPVGLIWAPNDVFADPGDIALLCEKLPNIILNHTVSNNRFNHVDFMYSKHAREEVYEPLIESIEKLRFV